MERMDNDVKIMGNIYGFDGGNFAGNVYDTEGLAPAIRTCIGGNQQPMVVEKLMTDKVPSIKIRQATKEGFIDCRIGGGCDLDYPNSLTRRGRVIEEGNVSPTITTESIPNIIELGNPDFYNFLYEIEGEIYLIRIRKLTPKECWRLMGFKDTDFMQVIKVNSDTQLYKQAGNSIVKQVLMGIFSQLGIQGHKRWNDMSDSERKEMLDKSKFKSMEDK